MARQERAQRPTKTTEYDLEFASAQASKGWRDLSATTRNAIADAWDSLTKFPLRNDKQCHPLHGKLSRITLKGIEHIRRQYELPGGARIWYYVVEGKPGTVYILEVHTHHPNQTK